MKSLGRIGLTGGLASGKSLATQKLRDLKIPVLDADEIAHELTKPGTPAFEAIVNQWGKTFLKADGSLNRVRLREHIFSEPMAKAWLEQLLHPPILEQLNTLQEGILVIPLLIEKNLKSLVDQLWVIDCTQKQQIQRALARDHSALTTIQAILAQQATRAERLAQADVVLHNEGSPEALYKQIIVTLRNR